LLGVGCHFRVIPFAPGDRALSRAKVMVAPSAVTKRRSGRSTGQPSRYRAGSDLPTEFQDLVHTAAADAVSKSAHTFEAVRVLTLGCTSLCSPTPHPTASSHPATRPPHVCPVSFWRQGAVVALEEALEPMLEALCKQALEHAKKSGREEITEVDLKAVSKNFKGK
jgi:hypothetical protein